MTVLGDLFDEKISSLISAIFGKIGPTI